MAWTDLILVTKTRKWVWWYINKLIENCEYLKGGGSARIGFLEGYFKNDTPAVWGDRLLLLVGQVVTISSYQNLCDAVYCGDANNATAPCFYKTSDVGGTTRSTVGNYMVMPDARGCAVRGLDLSGSIDPEGASRLLGSSQNHALQETTGSFEIRLNSGVGSVSGVFGFSATGGPTSMNQFETKTPATNGSLFSFDNSNSISPNVAQTDDVETRMTNIAVNIGIGY
jgi:hypothetical protein